MRAAPLVVDLREDDPSTREPVVAHMVAMAAASDGWLNLTPGLATDEAPPERTAFAQLLGSRGPTVPLATWTPARKREPATAGIEHGEGPKAAATLGRLGAPVPPGWKVLQDHPKRGLVVAMADATTAPVLDDVLTWLMRAAGALCAWPRTGEWRALAYGLPAPGPDAAISPAPDADPDPA
jgi:hypothetical protein